MHVLVVAVAQFISGKLPLRYRSTQGKVVMSTIIPERETFNYNFVLNVFFFFTWNEGAADSFLRLYYGLPSTET